VTAGPPTRGLTTAYCKDLQYAQQQDHLHTPNDLARAGATRQQIRGLYGQAGPSELGIYLNLEPKYLLDYAVETAFREDHRRLPPGEVADVILHYAERRPIAGLARLHAGQAPRERAAHADAPAGCAQWATEGKEGDFDTAGWPR
jgi:hypothetical protein